MTKQELKEKISARLDFWGTVMEAMKEMPDMDVENYRVKILTVFLGDGPITTLSYEKEGNRLKIWFITDPETEAGKSAYLEEGTFEENLDRACEILMDVFGYCEAAKEKYPNEYDEEDPAYTIKWLGDE